MIRIVYPEHNGVCIITPSGSLSILETARKDVPAGAPYKIIDVADIPADRSHRDLWEVDFSNPDGYGIGPEAWFAEQEGSK